MYQPDDYAIENQRAIKAARGCTWAELALDMDGSDPAFARWMRRQHELEDLPDVVVVVPSTIPTPDEQPPAPELRDQVRELVREVLDELGIQIPDSQEAAVQESQESTKTEAAEARAAEGQETHEGQPEKRQRPPRGRRSEPKGEA